VVVDSGKSYGKIVAWSKFKLIVVPIPAANIIARSIAPVDYSNYKEVARYYGLQE
jgi:hypothetical protein